MGKNILVMTGSHRKHGNSDLMAESFMNGAKTTGHTITKYEAAFTNISGCRACDTCWKKGVPCTFNDDFNEKFVPLLEQADILVLCLPLYFYGIPYSIQATLEKTYSLLKPESPIKMNISSAALLVCAGENDLAIFDGVVGTYKQICRGLQWNNQGIILAPGFYEKGAINNTDYLEQCRKLGQKM